MHIKGYQRSKGRGSGLPRSCYHLASCDDAISDVKHAGTALKEFSISGGESTLQKAGPISAFHSNLKQLLNIDQQQK